MMTNKYHDDIFILTSHCGIEWLGCPFHRPTGISTGRLDKSRASYIYRK